MAGSVTSRTSAIAPQCWHSIKEQNGSQVRDGCLMGGDGSSGVTSCTIMFVFLDNVHEPRQLVSEIEKELANRRVGQPQESQRVPSWTHLANDRGPPALIQ